MPTTSPPVYNGRYELSHQIARGGTAQVYLARDLLLDRPVALKMLFPELSTDRTFVDRFRREAQAAANLSHPNIVPVFDWGESDRTYYIVMEYVDGEPLSAIIRTQAPLDGAQAAGIAADIAKALSYAHRHGVVHRDIKPGNVLITSDGQVKVTDFGIARAIGSDENVTQTGLVMGTATYFSPEQAQGLGVDGRSDVYSLGVVLFEMLTARPPFSGETPVSIAYQHVREPAPTPRSINPDIPLTLEAIVLQAMAKQPSERYQSAQDFQADLQRWIQGGSVMVPAHDLGLPSRGGGAVGGGNGAPPGGAAGVLAGAAGGAAAGAVADGLTAAYPAERGAATAVVGAAGVGAGALASAGGGGTGAAVATRAPAPTGGIAVSPAVGAPIAAPGSPETRRVDGKPPLPKRRTLEWAIAAVALLAVMMAVVFVGGRALGYFGGNAWFPLPNYTQGMTLNQARQALSEKGLVLSSVGYGPSTATPKGQIIQQQPEPGTEVQRGTPVTLTVSTGPPSHLVPNVEGQTSADAIQNLKADGFLYTIRQQSQPPGSQCQQNHVCSQVPAPNVSEKEGTVVTLVVARGLADVPIPAIASGTTQTAATLTLAKAGFTNVSQSFQPSQTVKQGLVIGTTPAAGTVEPPGTPVTLIISSGPPVIVPNVLGETEQAATNLLQSEQFVVTPVQATDCNQQANGTVLSTSPGPGTSVAAGSPVTIVVATFDPNSCKTTTTSTSSTTPGNTGNTGNTGGGGGGGKGGHH